MAAVLLVTGLDLVAEPPLLIPYQGRYLDAQGEAATGTVDVTVRIFSQSVGGSPLWTQLVSNVDMYDGAYQFEFGDTNLALVLTNETCWLETEYDSTVMQARQLLVAVPFALHASYVDRLDNPVSDVPAGMIMMWSGALDSVPDGWALCDGSNGTPDLRTTFIMGASSSVAPGTTGGSNSLTLTVDQLPSHTHSASASSAGSHTHGASTGSAGSHTHSASTGSAGSHSHKIYQRTTYGGYRDRTGGHNNDQYGSENDFETRNNPGNHTHTLYVNSGGSHTHTVSLSSSGDHSHTVSVGTTGGTDAIDNRPATILLGYIMKL